MLVSDLNPKGLRCNWVSPFAGHQENGGLVQSRPDQRIHLGQETAQPAGKEEERAGVRDHYGRAIAMRSTYNR